MTARERYYLNHHLYRLMLWQIAMAEQEVSKMRAERREKVRTLRAAYKYWKLGVRAVIADNVRVYNRAIARGV